MRFVSVGQLRRMSAEVWRKLPKEREMVVTSNGNPIAILSSVTEETLQETLSAIPSARAVAAVRAMQRASVNAGTHRIPLAEIDREIAAMRRKRR